VAVDWQQAYLAALRAAEEGKLEERIERAILALYARVDELRRQQGASRERLAISDAFRNLDALRRDATAKRRAAVQ
jgi:hypothetical protein